MICSFNIVPNDVLQKVLWPYLDYDTRISLNMCLPAFIRIGVPFHKVKLIQHAMKLSTEALKTGLHIVNKSSSYYRDTALYNYVNVILPKHIIVAQYNKNFRQVVVDRVAYFSDVTSPEYSGFTDEFKTDMLTACRNIQQLMNGPKPYICEIMSANDTWTPVDAGLHLIAENTLAGDICISDGRILKGAIRRKKESSLAFVQENRRRRRKRWGQSDL